MAFGWDDALALAVPAITSIFSAKSAEKGQREANSANAQQAANEMAFQERMSSTAHQREVADLRAAGLNPILSAHGGASTPGGAMATFQSPTAVSSDTIAKLPERSTNSAMNIASINLAKAQAANQLAQTELNSAQKVKTETETQMIAPGASLMRRGINAGKRLVSWAAKPTGSAIGNLVTPQISKAHARRLAIINAYDNSKKG